MIPVTWKAIKVSPVHNQKGKGPYNFLGMPGSTEREEGPLPSFPCIFIIFNLVLDLTCVKLMVLFSMTKQTVRSGRRDGVFRQTKGLCVARNKTASVWGYWYPFCLYFKTISKWKYFREQIKTSNFFLCLCENLGMYVNVYVQIQIRMSRGEGRDDNVWAFILILFIIYILNLIIIFLYSIKCY